jgi:hypothetical protein
MDRVATWWARANGGPEAVNGIRTVGLDHPTVPLVGMRLILALSQRVGWMEPHELALILNVPANQVAVGIRFLSDLGAVSTCSPDGRVRLEPSSPRAADLVDLATEVLDTNLDMATLLHANHVSPLRG